MLDKSKTYLIVGLGLLGGKYAQVLSQKGYNVTGITHSQSTLDYALQHGYIRAGKNADFEDLVREADCIIFGLYPTVLLDWVKQYGRLIRPGTMVTDVSGVKRGVVEPVQAALPENGNGLPPLWTAKRLLEPEPELHEKIAAHMGISLETGEIADALRQAQCLISPEQCADAMIAAVVTHSEEIACFTKSCASNFSPRSATNRQPCGRSRVSVLTQVISASVGTSQPSTSFNSDNIQGFIAFSPSFLIAPEQAADSHARSPVRPYEYVHRFSIPDSPRDPCRPG